MSVSFTIEAYGEKLIRRELLDVGDRALDARPAFRAIVDDFREFERARFDSRGEGTWVALSPVTVAEKARKHLDPRILHATTRLRKSLTQKGAEGSYSRVYPQFMLFGTTVPYAGYLQRGTRRMPARKPLGFTEAQKVQTMKRLQRFVVHGDAAA